MTTTTVPAEMGDPVGAARRPRFALLVLTAAQVMLVLDVTVVNVALPAVGDALDLDEDTVPWVVTAYIVAFGGLMLLGGRLADLVGARRTLRIGLGIFSAASLLCALSGTAVTLIAGRAVQGLGAALVSPSALSLVTAAFTGERRTRALGVWGAVSGGAAAFGVVLGGLLTSTVGWQWIFAINVPVGVLLLATAPLAVPAPARANAVVRPDVPGALLVTAGTAGVIFGLTNAGSHGWAAPGTLLTLAGGVAAWAVFGVVERSSRSPLLRLALLRQGPVAAGAFLMVTATGLMVGTFFIGSFALQRAHGLGALQAGLAFLPVALAGLAGSHAAGRLLGRFSARSVAVTGLGLAAAGQSIAAALAQPVVLVAGLTAAALGIGATFVTAFASALTGTEPQEAGLRSAVVSTFHELGGAIGVAALASVAGSALTTASPEPVAFTGALTFGAVAAAVGAASAVLLVPAGVQAPPPGSTPHTHP